MFLFCSILFILVSIFLIFFILLQPSKGFGNNTVLSGLNNIQLFNGTGKNSFITNMISFFGFLFLFLSIVLCNINNAKIKKDNFWDKEKKHHVNIKE